MKKLKNIEDGINGLGIGVVNTNSKEFKELQRIIKEKANKLSKNQIQQNKLLSLRFQMQSYLESSDKDIIEVGSFLKEFLNQLDIKKKTFAEYLGLQESNLSALFKGKRKINIDLAIKLGTIFRIDPILWIHIQSKNELIKLHQENRKEYQKYKLSDLLKKAS